MAGKVNIAVFKKMYRLIDYQRRVQLIQVCREFDRTQPQECRFTYKQLDYLMLIRMAMPCHLSDVMKLTGLSSSAASLFIDKMVRAGFVIRESDPEDRRNILIRPSAKIQELLDRIDSQLDSFIDERLVGCTKEELEAIERTGALVCRKIEELSPKRERP